MKQPDIGSHTPRPPHPQGQTTTTITHAVAQGATIGSIMWFHEDMVNALRGGATRDGWTGTVLDDGTLVVGLDVLGVRHRWALTGKTAECTGIPGTLVHEAQWVD
jgi:hypothetical protein